jgi:hypothetical protein
MLSVRVQCPAVQAHAHGCVSAVPSLVTTEIPQTDVLGGVVVGVILVATAQALEILAVTVVGVGESTV